ncbi:tRNA (guanosine(37)-N1)-methyltransferase TrmD [bacterium]|nr:tRNA (guanosine(37)-N1)-methyltransferase TrmD [bacterium]
MKFDIITIFPEIFDFYFKHSILKKAQEKGVIKIKVHNLRDFTEDKHKKVDDKPFGGGRGMILKLEPIFKAVSSLRNPKQIPNPKSRVILFTPRGKKFNQKMASQFAKLEQLILICGRYEGIDERVAKYLCDEQISIGDYVLMGGELPALVFIETVARLIKGVIGKSELLEERITKEKGFREYPQYTRPEVFEPKKGVQWKVPKVLLSGNHKKIEEWRKKHSKIIE